VHGHWLIQTKKTNQSEAHLAQIREVLRPLAEDHHVWTNADRYMMDSIHWLASNE